MKKTSVVVLLARVLLIVLLGTLRAQAGSISTESVQAATHKDEKASYNNLLFRDAPSDPAPQGSPALRTAGDGVTAIAGRVLATEDGQPLQGVELRMGIVRTQTDQDGLFLIENVTPGEAVLVIDGRRARTQAASAIDRGLHETRVRAEAGRTTLLPWVSWLPRIDHAHDVMLDLPSKEDNVARTPSVPGLELRIPKGAVLTGIDGESVTRVGLTAIPVNRPPFPLPRNVQVPVYFTAQPGGAVISSADGQWLGMQVLYPNYGHELPKARGVFWRYEPDGLGWAPYGMGTVTADGRQVLPDPQTRIYALSGAMFSEGGHEPPAGPPPPPMPIAAPATKPPPPEAPDPVDLATGLYVQRQTDLSLDGVMPIEVTRTYRPGDYNRREFGVGASLTYGALLFSANQYQVVDLILPDGGLVHYTRIINPANPTDNAFQTAHFTTSTPGLFYKSRIDWNNNGWNLIRTDGTLYVFADNAPLQYIQDRFGNRITLTHSNGTAGNITEVSSSNGRSIRFTYNGNNCITQAVDNLGRTVTYTYDSSSRLSTATDPNGGVTTYNWDSSNRVQSITDARGTTFVTLSYDTFDRVISQTFANGSAYGFAYTNDTISLNGINVTRVKDVTVTDPRGYNRKITFDVSGPVVAGYALTDTWAVGTPQQAAWTYVRDPVSNMITSMTDPLGRQTNITYDANGNVLSVTRLAGTSNAVTTSFTYEPIFNQLATITDPLGHVTTLQRDSLGRLTGVNSPLGTVATFTYNAQGNILTLSDALNNTTQFAYGPDGDPTSTTDPLGRVTNFYTDAIGRIAKIVDPLGNTTRALLDPIEGTLQSFDANGAATAKTFTPIGGVATVTDARGGQIAYTYDASNLLATRTDAVGAVESVTQRDGMGNILTLSDRKSQTVSMTYDPLNRPLTVSYADGSTASLTWDLAGRLTQLQDSAGGTVTRTYDGLDRLTSETTPQGTVNYTYDAADRRVTAQAGSQAQVTYSYDDANRLTSITQGSTAATFAYDAAGRRGSVALPGGITATYTWDAASELTQVTYAKGSTTLGSLTYGYDATRRVVSRGGDLFQSVLPSAVTSATYDLANRLTARTVAGIGTSPTFDRNGNLTSDGVQSYTWDARNRLTGISGVANFTYDGYNRRQTATRSGIATSFLYDGWDVAQEQQGGNPSADLLLGLNFDERFTRSGSTILTDLLGSTVALASAGAIQTSYGYDVYGQTQVTGASSDNTFQFTGRENDNTGLMNFRNRYYNPQWGRFISEDPIGLRGGINVYNYVGNDPTNNGDPAGTCRPEDVMCQIAMRQAGLPQFADPDPPPNTDPQCRAGNAAASVMVCIGIGIATGFDPPIMGSCITKIFGTGGLGHKCDPPPKPSKPKS